MVVVTIGGDPGSGKSTLGRMLAARLSIPFFSMGDVWREYAKKHGMKLAELHEKAKKDPEIDRKIDEYQSRLAEKHPSFIIDSRLGFHFIKGIKIYVTVDVKEGAKRIFEQTREGESWSSIDEGAIAIEKRKRDDRIRYKELYNLDPSDLAHYDFVIDSTNINALEKLEKVLNFLDNQGVSVPK